MPNWEVTIDYKDRGRPGSVKVLATDQPNERAAIEVALDVAAENVPWDEQPGVPTEIGSCWNDCRRKDIMLWRGQ